MSPQLETNVNKYKFDEVEFHASGIASLRCNRLSNISKYTDLICEE